MTLGWNQSHTRAPILLHFSRTPHPPLLASVRWGRATGQEGIMPLFLLRSAMLRRLWLAPRLLLVSFFRRSSNVSVVCPCPLGRPTTLLERSGRKLQPGRQQRRECRVGERVSFFFFKCHNFSEAHIFKNMLDGNRPEQSEPEQTEHRLYPFLCCMAALRASARSLSTAGSCTNWSLFTAP